MTAAQARAFAEQAHGAQTYGDAPYVVHLDAVAALVPPQPEALKVVAYLHDVLEDTETTADALQARFGPVVAQAVEHLTDPPGPRRADRKEALHRRLSALSIEDTAAALALHVKAADRLANVRACVRTGDARLALYRREHAVFRAAAYRPGLCDPLWAELDTLLQA